MCWLILARSVCSGRSNDHWLTTRTGAVNCATDEWEAEAGRIQEWAEKLKQAVLLTRAVVQRGPDAPTHATVAAGSGERRVGSGASAAPPSKRAPEPEARLALVRGLGNLTWAA